MVTTNEMMSYVHLFFQSMKLIVTLFSWVWQSSGLLCHADHAITCGQCGVDHTCKTPEELKVKVRGICFSFVTWMSWFVRSRGTRTILHTQSQVYDEFMLWEQNTQLQRAHTHTVSERSGWTYQWTLCVSVVSWGEAREYGFQNMFFYDLFMKILRNAFMNKKCLVFTLWKIYETILISWCAQKI